MDELQHPSKPESEETQQLNGYRKKVNAAVKNINVFVIVCILLIIVFVAIDLREPGHTITFNSMGGSDVASQEQMYGELLVLPDPPTREGYSFIGWFKDHACFEAWNADVDTIVSEMTLYAGWEKIE